MCFVKKEHSDVYKCSNFTELARKESFALYSIEIHMKIVKFTFQLNNNLFKGDTVGNVN